jgi:hypothetical protein
MTTAIPPRRASVMLVASLRNAKGSRPAGARASSNQVFVRSEANSHFNGRVYRVAYTVSDGQGGSGSGTAGPGGNTTAKVGVPARFLVGLLDSWRRGQPRRRLCCSVA